MGLHGMLQLVRSSDPPAPQPPYRFPRPSRPADILLPDGTGVPTAVEIFDLLADPSAQEAWTHLTRDADSIRLLVSKGWVFKTRPTDKLDDLREATGKLEACNQYTARIGVWHPAKKWFALRASHELWLCNVSPRLRTLDQFWSIAQRSKWRLLWCWLKLVVERRHGLALDLKLRNFGVESGSGKIFYIDDEVYPVNDSAPRPPW